MCSTKNQQLQAISSKHTRLKFQSEQTSALQTSPSYPSTAVLCMGLSPQLSPYTYGENEEPFNIPPLPLYLTQTTFFSRLGEGIVPYLQFPPAWRLEDVL